ncbi:MAG TPA: acetolactate synthase large subunit [Steroidobacteraceae bacterium]|nr:acetolactate synthase large subunit [Steroidobacteraceae bacterium]
MNGAQSLIGTLVNCGVEVCFGNPGTSEMHFVAALDSSPGMRAVLCLFEGVATGAADGYGRMAGRPAAVLLHLGPGLANGLANLHNARRAASPVVAIVGDHATSHLQYDAPLTSDIVGFARPVSSWIVTSKSALTVASDAARAVQAATAAPGAVATLILPADSAWNEAERAATPLPRLAPQAVPGEVIDETAKLLGNGKRTALLLRGAALLGPGLEAAGRVAAKTGTRLVCDMFAPRTELGAGRVLLERLPYFAEQIVEFLAGIEQLVLVGAQPPVSFFAYPGVPSWCSPEGCRFATLAHPHEDGVQALEALDRALGGTAPTPARVPLQLPAAPEGPLTPLTLAQGIARLTPEHAVLSDESITVGFVLAQAMTVARPHDHLPCAGGSIGQGLPVAVGAAIACPDRKVVCIEGDGSAAYTLQALWTMARENLDVTVVVCANRSYRILTVELERVGASGAGPKASSMLDLQDPEMDWTRIAQGLGLEASRASTSEEFIAQYGAAMRQRGPRLIEAML